jgi:predicted ATPase/DNA-binding SARP family transcriptional activator
MLEFRILGPLEVRCDGRALDLPGLASRRLLALLVLRSGGWVTADRLVDELWEERPPDSARKALQMHVSRLRRAFGAAASVLQSGAAGYRLGIAPEQVDAGQFERLAEEAAELVVSDPERAREQLVAALGLWRGAALAELSLGASGAGELARLEELRLLAVEHRLDADLRLGRHVEVIGELQNLVAEHPLRERLHAQLMLALYRAGRQGDALAAYRAARRVLVDELGIEPGPALQRLQASILRQDADLDPPQSPSRARRGRTAAATGLPIARTRTVGRDQDVARLRELLADARLLTLVGAGGIGKTRLAVVLARTVQTDYEDGVRFVSLATTESAQLVTATVAAAMGVVPLAAEPPLDGLVRLIGDKRMLVMLDSFEHVLAAAEVVSDLLEACPGLGIVATSREPLRLSGEQVFVVGPLALPQARDELELDSIQRAPAIQLFADRCRARDPGFALSENNAVTIARICARLEGMPLAIELAAAHAGLLGPEELTERLDDALAVLVGGPRDAPTRQRTLRATLDWSYALLDQHEQDAFARLAVFSGGCTLNAAESVTGARFTTVEALLAKSLLVMAGPTGAQPRIRMLEPIRAYALEQLEQQPDVDELRDRHCEYYTEFAERAERALRGPEQMTWLRRLDANLPNLRAAVQWSQRAHRPELGLRLASARGMHASGLYFEIRDWLEAALEAAVDVDRRLHARARLALGELMTGGPGAIEHEREALRLFRVESDMRGTVEALVALSIDVDQAGDRAEAEDLARQALELARTIGDERLIALALDAQVLGSPESFPATKHLGAQGLAIWRRLGDRIMLSIALSNFGYAAMAAGDLTTALSALDEAVAVSEELEYARGLPLNLVNRGLAYALDGEDRRAAGDFGRALALCRESGLALPVAEALTGLTAVAVRRGDIELASRLSGASHAHRLFDAFSAPELRLEHQVIDPARARVAQLEWQKGWAAGNALSFNQALTLGMSAAAAPT